MLQRRSWEFNLLPIVLITMGLLMIAVSFVLTTTRTSSQNGMWMGTSGTMTGYSITNVLIAVIGAFMFTSGLMYLLLRQEYEPLPPSAMPTLFPTSSNPLMGAPQMAASNPATRSEPETVTVPSVPDTPAAVGLPSATSIAMASGPDDGHQSAYYLALRLLSGDERTIFRVIMDSGGEALQKDLIVKTKMSDAKVSRVIDRLEEKGVVTKMRFGMTNKVRIEIET